MKKRILRTLLSFTILFGMTQIGALSLTVAADSASTASSTNNLSTYQSLTGTYFVLRHGESIPSLEKRVCSTMESGTDPSNGLTEKGRREVSQSVSAWLSGNTKLLADYLKKDKLVIVTSPFSRTKESADILADVLQKGLSKYVPKKYQSEHGLRQIIIVENNLRERNFGKFEGDLKSNLVYEKVWEQDKLDPNHKKWKVESTAGVQDRASRVVAQLEEESKKAGGKLFILVSHGDTLKILQTAFQKQSSSEHANPAQVAPFKTAEIRQMTLSANTAQAQK